MAKTLSYRQAGVDIDASDQWTETIKGMVQRTYGPRVLSGVGGFAGLFGLDFYDEKLFKRTYRQPVLVACTDGVGTKILIARDARKLDTVGIDLVAMNVNDMVVCGAEPLFFLDYMAIGKLDPKSSAELLQGITVGCMQADCALIGGETAEMPDLYKNDDFDLAGFAVGVVELKRIINGKSIEPGDTILGLASSGLHSNGYTLARKVMFDILGHKLDDVLPGFDCTVAEEMLRPTKIYVKPLLKTLRKYRVKQPIRGMAHITGGGLVGNIPRILPENCRAIIHTDSWPVPKIFTYLQTKGPIDPSEMFRVFNMGIGMVLIVRPAFANSIAQTLLRCGETVYKIGRIKAGKPEVELR
ncbi:MAG: phosphoribosylformylglycinamidine cyclo-ligase [Phycisphaerae bacterium]